MARSDRLKNPKPAGGASRETVDFVLAAFNAGNALLSLLSGLLASVLILYSGYVLYDSFSTEYGAYSSSWDLLRYKPEIVNEEPSEGAETLAAINRDYRAWLTVYETTIDYPVVQGEDDLYYASHDIYGNSSLTGAIYLAAGNSGDLSDSYNVVYGHHMDNGAMFGSLDRFGDGEYFRNHQTGLLVAGKKIYDLTLFAVVNTDAYESKIYTPGNRAEEVKAFLTGDRSGDAGLGTKVLVYDEAVARSAAKIIALSTCADAATNGRLVVLARMTERVFETPAPDPVRLTVRYVTEDGRHVFPTQVFVYQVGDSYYVVPPVLPGYTASVTIIRGTITEDMSVVVRYVPVDYTLTVHYVFLNGMEAAKTWTGTLHVGDAYDVRSPEVKGYIPVTQRVRGTNPGRDESYTVIYIPEDADIEKLTRLEDFDIPLGLGRTFMHQGVCVE